LNENIEASRLQAKIEAVFDILVFPLTTPWIVSRMGFAPVAHRSKATPALASDRHKRQPATRVYAKTADVLERRFIPKDSSSELRATSLMPA
jgi:hypothetical protein